MFWGEFCGNEALEVKVLEKRWGKKVKKPKKKKKGKIWGRKKEKPPKNMAKPKKKEKKAELLLGMSPV